jgi:transposase
VGDANPKRQGGDRRSARIEAHAAVILYALERKSDITLADLRAELAGRGIGVSVAGLWRFFKRRRITLKKRPGMRPSRIVPTS